MRGRGQVLATVGVAVLSLLLAGCGSTDEGALSSLASSAAEEVPGERAEEAEGADAEGEADAPADVAATSSAAPAMSTGSRWRITETWLEGREPVMVDPTPEEEGGPFPRAEGEVDAEGDLRMDLVLGGGHILMPMEVVVADDEVFLRAQDSFALLAGPDAPDPPEELAPDEPAPWLHLVGEIQGFISGGGMLGLERPTEVMAAFVAGGQTPTPIGPDEVDGVAVEVRTVDVDTATMLAAVEQVTGVELPTEEPEDAEEAEDLEDALANEVRFDFSVSSDGEVRRMVFYSVWEAESVAREPAGDRSRTVSATVVDVLELAVPVEDVRAPADAAEVRTEDELDAGLGGF